jgi:gamma-glutamyltranspeptidase/glutathione hydrolase
VTAAPKRAAVSTRGIVAAQHPAAAEAGLRLLAEGGNAVDAAIAATLAVGVAEPWLSGIGGGGLMLLRLAGEGRTYGIDFSMVSPRRLDAGRYALATGTDAGRFQWPRVDGDRNISGPESICVPGAVAGLGFAAERFGRLPWRTLIQPAIEIADAGLATHPTTRAVFLPNGDAPKAEAGQRLVNPALARTLRRLAEAGPRDFYEGEIARKIVQDLAAAGSVLDRDDLAGYQARLVEPARLDYRGTTIAAMPGLTGGPTYLAAMASLRDALPDDLSPDAFVAYARAIGAAYADRLAAPRMSA